MKQAVQLLNDRYVSKLINKLYNNGTVLNGHSQQPTDQLNTPVDSN